MWQLRKAKLEFCKAVIKKKKKSNKKLHAGSPKLNNYTYWLKSIRGILKHITCMAHLIFTATMLGEYDYLILQVGKLRPKSVQ